MARLIVGGTTPRSNESAVTAASTALAAPIRWPIIDFCELGEFIYVPVQDLAPALALYRDTLGLDELWREGDLTVGLGIPGNEAPLMVDAQDTNAIASGLTRLLSDEALRRTLVERGRERLKQFTWEKTASRVAEVFERVAGRS